MVLKEIGDERSESDRVDSDLGIENLVGNLELYFEGVLSRLTLYTHKLLMRTRNYLNIIIHNLKTLRNR